MKPRIGMVLGIVSALIISFGAGTSRADYSLNDLLNGVCFAPVCIKYTGNTPVPIKSSDDTVIGAKDWAPYNKNAPTFLFIHGYPHGQGLWYSQVISPLLLKYRLVTMDTRAPIEATSAFNCALDRFARSLP